MLKDKPDLPKLILFDLGNVFLDAKQKITYNYLENLGVPRKKAVLFFLSPAYKKFARGQIDQKQFCDKLRKFLDSPFLSDSQLRTAHDEHVFGIVKGMPEILKKLSRKFREESIAFITDSSVWQTAKQQKLINLKRYKIFSSEKTGMLKLDPEILGPGNKHNSVFLYVLKSLNIHPQEALFIDDSKRKVERAKEYGINGIQFINTNQLETELKRRRII